MRFFSDFQGEQDQIPIQGEELFHLIKVLQGKIGDPVEVINGEGYLAIGKIQSIQTEKAIIKAESFFSAGEAPGQYDPGPFHRSHCQKPQSGLVREHD